jgi:hypothetical protein
MILRSLVANWDHHVAIISSSGLLLWIYGLNWQSIAQSIIAGVGVFAFTRALSWLYAHIRKPKA